MFRFFGVFLFILYLLIHPYTSHSQEKIPSELEKLTIEYYLRQKDPIIIEVIKLDYVNAEHLASILTPLLSKDGRVVPYEPTNSLIIKDRASIVKRLIEIIKGKPRP